MQEKVFRRQQIAPAGAKARQAGGRLRVDLWFWPLGHDGENSPDWAILSDEERERAERFVFASDRASYVSAHVRLRRILGSHLNQAPEAIAFTKNEYGKPALAAGAPHFSLSHSHGQAALAVCWDSPIGIDIERLGNPDFAVATHFFSTIECAALEALPIEIRAEGFYRCWTRKEAIVKADGRGLSVPLKAFAVSVVEPAELLWAEWSFEPNPAAWRLLEISPPAGYVGAIALRSDHGAPVVCVCDGGGETFQERR